MFDGCHHEKTSESGGSVDRLYVKCVSEFFGYVPSSLRNNVFRFALRLFLKGEM